MMKLNRGLSVVFGKKKNPKQNKTKQKKKGHLSNHPTMRPYSVV